MINPYQIKQNDYGENIPSQIPLNVDGDPVEDSAPVIIPEGEQIVLNSRDTVRELSRTINANEDSTSKPIVRLWSNQESIITESEIQSSGLSGSAIDNITESYDSYASDILTPTWIAISTVGASNVVGKNAVRGGIVNIFDHNPDIIPEPILPGPSADSYIRARKLDLVTRMSTQQRETARDIIQAGLDSGLNERVIARNIRNSVGLDSVQARSVRNLRAQLIADKVPKGRIESIVAKRIKQFRVVRAKRIARTEMTWAYNMGQLDAVKSYQSAGIIPKGVVIAKVWRKVLPVPECFCDNLNGQTVGLDSTFPGMTELIPNVLTPPAHPNCACAIDMVVQSGVI